MNSLPSRHHPYTPRLACTISLAALLLTAVAHAAPVALAPIYGSDVASGRGASATFVQIDSAWQGSTVLWNEPTLTYGSGTPIGSFGWGTGLWGRADFHTVQHAFLTGATAPGLPTIVNSWVGTVTTINHGNSAYNTAHAAVWGLAALVPFFADAQPDRDEHNWTAHYSGFLHIATPGEYNFSVLFDDGFFFRLLGAGGAALEIGRDFLNPRDRLGFDHNLLLSPGLYGFELGLWNRLEAGVVDLRWMLPGTTAWTLVPGEHLRPMQNPSPMAVPLPPTAALVLLGLGLLAASRGVARRAAARPANAAA
jgi:hypothetical protein